MKQDRQWIWLPLSEAVVDAAEEGGVISSSEKCSSIVVDGTREARAGTETEPEVEEGQAMDLAFSRASLSEAVVDAAAEDEGVISSSEICSSIVVDGTGKARAGTEAEPEVEAGQAMDLASSI